MKNTIFGIIVLTLLVNSCKKPKENEECTWELETTNMHYGTCEMTSFNEYQQYKCDNLDSLDTCNYDLFLISLYFDIEYLTHNSCSSPNDSIIGNINNLIVTCNNDYNQNLKKNDTVNSILEVAYQEFNSGITETLVPLDSYLLNNPICTGYINLLFSQPPDSISVQSFKIIYKESDGTLFTIETKPIYIKP